VTEEGKERRRTRPREKKKLISFFRPSFSSILSRKYHEEIFAEAIHRGEGDLKHLMEDLMPAVVDGM
jgi:hypothetical protein